MWNDSKDIEFQRKNVFFGEVISIENKTHTGRITVRIEELDKNINDADLPPCYPFFNFQFLNLLPKKGERVSVILDRSYSGEKTMNQEKRYWNSVTISQPDKILYDPYYYTASSAETDGYADPINIDDIPDAKGVNPLPDEVAIRGRENTDITFKEGEIVVRAGRHEKNNPLKFNELDPAFIQIKHKNSSAVPKYKTIDTFKEIPATHIIKVSDDSNSVLIKVIDKKATNVVETYSETFVDRKKFVASTRKKILEFQSKYKKWELRTSIDELMDMPLIYPNNKISVKTKVLDENQQRIKIPSVISVVADKINFLSHLSVENDLTDSDDIISAETLEGIINNAERMVNGNTLIGFLKLIKTYLNNHVHPYPNMEPVQDDILKKINNFNLEVLVNENIRLG
jgi:hypothetical protein